MSITALAFLFSPVCMSYPMMGSGLAFLNALFELWISGAGGWNAVVYTLAAVSTGGFSPYDTSRMV